MSYSIHDKTPTPSVVRFLQDRPALMDRYDDVKILRENLLIHQRVKVPPSESIVKQLQRKKRRVKRTRNLRGELAKIKTQQRRFEKGERRDKSQAEPRIVGDPVRGAGGIAFDPEVERQRVEIERDRVREAQGRLALEGRQLNINRQLAIDDRNENIRQFNALLQERQGDHRREIEDRRRARELQFDADAAERGERLAQEDRARREQLEFEERRAAQDFERQRAELQARLGGEQEILRINREAEYRQLAERNQLELQRADIARQERAEDEARQIARLDQLDQARREQVDLLREQGDLNRQVLLERVSEIDREREQRREQREADYVQRGLHEIDNLISTRIREAAERFRRGELDDPEPEITILGGAERARRESGVGAARPSPASRYATPEARGGLSDSERADLNRDIADTIRRELQQSPRDIARRAREEAQQAERDLAEEVPEVPPARIPEITEDQQQRVEDALERALSPRARSPRAPSPVERRQSPREQAAEEQFYERQPSPASPLDPIDPERLQRGGGSGGQQFSSEDEASGGGSSGGELQFSLEAVEPPPLEGRPPGEAEPPEEQGVLGRLAGGVRQVGRMVQRGQEAFEDLRREAGRGEQTGGVLETPQGERLVGLGQEIPREGLQPDPDEAERLGGEPPPLIPSRSPGEVVRETGFEEQAEEEEFFQPRPEPEPEAPPLRPEERIEDVQEEEAARGGVAQEEELQGALFEETEGQGVQGQDLRENYQIYQALRPDLDALQGRRGGKRGAGVQEFIPFEITNVSDRDVKKIQPGQTIQLKGVLNTGEIRFELPQPGETPGTLKSVKIGKQALEKQIREGRLKITRKTD